MNALARLIRISAMEAMRHPSRILYHWRQAQSCSRSGTSLTRLNAFCTSLALWFHTVAFPDRTAERSYKILGQTVTAYGYKGLSILFREIYIEAHYAITLKAPKPVIIDCGANIGLSVLYFKSLHPEATIYAFEPNPKAFTLLERNVKDNGLRNVALYNRALAAADGETTIFVNNDPASLHASLNARRGGDVPIKVAGYRLSHLIQEIGHVDLVKIDTEGSEREIIIDLAERSLLNRVTNFIIEYHHDTESCNDSLARLLIALSASGFHFIIDTNLPRYGNHQDIMIRLTRQGSESSG